MAQEGLKLLDEGVQSGVRPATPARPSIAAGSAIRNTLRQITTPDQPSRDAELVYGTEIKIIADCLQTISKVAEEHKPPFAFFSPIGVLDELTQATITPARLATVLSRIDERIRAIASLTNTRRFTNAISDALASTQRIRRSIREQNPATTIALRIAEPKASVDIASGNTTQRMEAVSPSAMLGTQTGLSAKLGENIESIVATKEVNEPVVETVRYDNGWKPILAEFTTARNTRPLPQLNGQEFYANQLLQHYRELRRLASLPADNSIEEAVVAIKAGQLSAPDIQQLATTLRDALIKNIPARNNLPATTLSLIHFEVGMIVDNLSYLIQVRNGTYQPLSLPEITFSGTTNTSGPETVAQEEPESSKFVMAERPVVEQESRGGVKGWLTKAKAWLKRRADKPAEVKKTSAQKPKVANRWFATAALAGFLGILGGLGISSKKNQEQNADIATTTVIAPQPATDIDANEAPSIVEAQEQYFEATGSVRAGLSEQESRNASVERGINAALHNDQGKEVLRRMYDNAPLSPGELDYLASNIGHRLANQVDQLHTKNNREQVAVAYLGSVGEDHNFSISLNLPGSSNVQSVTIRAPELNTVHRHAQVKVPTAPTASTETPTTGISPSETNQANSALSDSMVTNSNSIGYYPTYQARQQNASSPETRAVTSHQKQNNEVYQALDQLAASDKSSSLSLPDNNKDRSRRAPTEAEKALARLARIDTLKAEARARLDAYYRQREEQIRQRQRDALARAIR
ncbi:MAG: hypothetical protein HY817_03310 [Candidatus Abawacabacteria bacterium]|nr:hypothetical protein [Candidatus Abawacabacteria bacterium]